MQKNAQEFFLFLFFFHQPGFDDGILFFGDRKGLSVLKRQFKPPHLPDKGRIDEITLVAADKVLAVPGFQTGQRIDRLILPVGRM